MDRTQTLGVKLTEEEMEIIKKKAKEEGLTMSTYVRLHLIKRGK